MFCKLLSYYDLDYLLGRNVGGLRVPNSQGTARHRRVLQGYRRELPTSFAPRPKPFRPLAPHVANAYKYSPTQRLQPEGLASSRCFFAAPYGVPGGRRWPSAADNSRRQPAATQ